MLSLDVKTKAILTATMLLIASDSKALARCPPEYGEKSTAFWVLGWTSLAIFFGVGFLSARIISRLRNGRPVGKRVGIDIAAVLAMIIVSLVGLAVFFRLFVLRC